MSYQLYDTVDYVGDVATNSGLVDLRLEVARERGLYPNFLAFLEQGSSLITQPLVAEMNKFSQTRKGGGIKSIVKNLIELVDRSTLAVFITTNPDESVKLSR